jgi:hypothetical protein
VEGYHTRALVVRIGIVVVVVDDTVAADGGVVVVAVLGQSAILSQGIPSTSREQQVLVVVLLLVAVLQGQRNFDYQMDPGRLLDRVRQRPAEVDIVVLQVASVPEEREQEQQMDQRTFQEQQMMLQSRRRLVVVLLHTVVSPKMLWHTDSTAGRKQPIDSAAEGPAAVAAVEDIPSTEQGRE